MPVFNPKKLFQLSGQNLNFAQGVFFGEDQVEEIFYLSNTGISGEVPAAAMTSEIFIEANGGRLSLGSPYIVLDSDSQLSVSGLKPQYVSGVVGDIIQISGDNFYKVTDVNFGGSMGGQSSEFSVLSENVIEAVVPTGAAYHEISVFSSLRTGAAGSTSLASGKTYNKFIPIPDVTGINSGQMLGGETLVVGGIGFSGVTGISINDIIFNDFKSLDATGVQATVPSGLQVGDLYKNTRGRIDLGLASGQSFKVSDEFSFNPLAKIAGVSTNAFIGSLLTISGENFNSGVFHTGEFDGSLGTGCLVSIGGQTGNFKIINDAGGYNRMQGHLPSGINLGVSGGNVAVGETNINTLPISLFSDNYPEVYPNDIRVRPGIGSPEVYSVSPKSGVGGDTVFISGANLYGITGINYRGGNVGVGTEFEQSKIVEVTPGQTLMSTIPDTANFGNNGGFLDLDVSGFFGNVGVTSAFFVYGVPVINTITPGGSGIEPGAPAVIQGQRLYSGSELEFYGGNGTLSRSNFRQNLNISGYSLNHTQINFNYPNNFETGNSYGIRVVNQRAGTQLYRVTGFNEPVLSGVNRVSGVQGERVIVSGYFERIKPSGLKLGEKIILDYEEVGFASNPHQFSGIVFDIPKNTSSNLITIDTSGGFISTTGVLNVTPAKPEISGFYQDLTGQRPDYYNSSEQAFISNNMVRVTGERLNLVTGINFSGINNGDPLVQINSFSQVSPFNLTFRLPTGINPNSGSFVLKDFVNRETVSPFPLNMVVYSGYSPSFPVPNEIINLSGANVTGLDLVFSGLDGNPVSPEIVTSAVSGGVDVLSVKTPTGIRNSNVLVTGRSNSNLGELFDFRPCPVITGVSGQSASNVITTGQLFYITGLNVDPSVAFSGGNILISGTGNKNSQMQQSAFAIEKTTTGDDLGVFYTKFDVRASNDFIGTGRFLFPDVGEAAKQAQFYGTEYVINGTRVNITGYGPIRGVTGDAIEFTGFGLNEVTEVYFSPFNASQVNVDSFNISPLVSAEFVNNSNNKITVTVPADLVEAKGKTNVLFSGGTNEIVSGFEVILDASVVEYNIVEENDVPTSASRVGNFTQKETINGTVFVVTRTRFPDGTTAIVSSTPFVGMGTT